MRKIILIKDVPNLGEEGDICVVKDGYARNFLLPTNAAVAYNTTNLAVIKSKAGAIDKRKDEKRKACSSLKEQLNNLSLTLVVSAGESGKLFGSVTPMLLQNSLAKEGFRIDRKKIEVATKSIKQVGNYSVKIHLYEGEFATIKIMVKSEAEIKVAEAKAIAEAEVAAKAQAKADAVAKAQAKADAKAVADAKEAAKVQAEATVEVEVTEEPETAEEEKETKAEDAE